MKLDNVFSFIKPFPSPVETYAPDKADFFIIAAFLLLTLWILIDSNQVDFNLFSRIESYFLFSLEVFFRKMLYPYLSHDMTSMQSVYQTAFELMTIAVMVVLYSNFKDLDKNKKKFFELLLLIVLLVQVSFILSPRITDFADELLFKGLEQRYIFIQSNIIFIIVLVLLVSRKRFVNFVLLAIIGFFVVTPLMVDKKASRQTGIQRFERHKTFMDHSQTL